MFRRFVSPAAEAMLTPFRAPARSSYLIDGVVVVPESATSTLFGPGTATVISRQ